VHAVPVLPAAHMGVDLGGLQVAVAEPLLQLPGRDALLCFVDAKQTPKVCLSEWQEIRFSMPARRRYFSTSFFTPRSEILVPW
jgi:hypothetical protein